LAEAAPFLFQLNVPFFPTSAGVSFSAREAPFLTILTAIIADDNKKKFARQERFGKKRRRFANAVRGPFETRDQDKESE